MKKVILILLAAVAFSCGDGSNRSSETDLDTRTEDNYSNDALEADTMDMRMDTTSTQGIDADTTSNNYSNP